MKNKLFALLVILGLMITACGGGAASSDGGGGTVVLIIPEEPAGPIAIWQMRRSSRRFPMQL